MQSQKIIRIIDTEYFNGVKMQDQTSVEPETTASSKTKLEIKSEVKKGSTNPKIKIYIAIAAFLGISIIITIVAILVLLLTRNGNGVQPNRTTPTVTSIVQHSITTPITSTTPVPSSTVRPTNDVSTAPTFTTTANLNDYGIFLNRDDGIYAYNVTTRSTIKIINNAEISFNLGSDKIIITQFTTDSHYDSTKYYLANLNTHSISFIKNITNTYGSDSYKYIIGFFNETNYVLVKITYLASTSSTSLVFVNGDTETDLGSIGVTSARGSYYGDSSIRYILSPDNNNLIFCEGINTATDSGVGSSVFIINKNTKSFIKINNSKMAFWLDSTHVLYQSSVDNRMYNYDLSARTSSLYSSFPLSLSDKFGLHMNGIRFIYWKEDHHIYIYNSETGTESILLRDATQPIFYSSNQILFSKLYADDFIPSGVRDDNLWIYNLDADTEVQIFNNSNNRYLLRNNKGVYICETITCED